jgi:hypothetical protein
MALICILVFEIGVFGSLNSPYGTVWLVDIRNSKLIWLRSRIVARLLGNASVRISLPFLRALIANLLLFIYIYIYIYIYPTEPTT